MTDVKTLGDLAWRDWTIVGMPSSGAHEPYKPDIRAFASAVETQKITTVDDLDALRAYEGDGATVTVLFGESFGDGLGGDYAVKPEDDESDDNGRRVIVGEDGRRWWQIDKSAHLVNAGIPSFDEEGNFVQDCGGINIGGPTGIWLKQEGRDTDYEEGSLAMYPRVPNRWCGLSINSSAAHPSELPTQNIASVGVQILNGEGAEERVVLSTHWLSPDDPDGDAEVRLGMIKTGVSTQYRPMRLHNADTYLLDVNPDKTVVFTNQALSGGAGGNTVVAFRNPGTTESFRAIVRTDGAAGFEKLSSASVDYSLLFTDTGARLSGNNPALWWNEEDAGTNEKKWWLDASGGVLRGILINDAEDSFATWLNVYRSGGTLTNITFAGDFTNAPLQIGPAGVGFFSTGPTAKQTVTGSRGGNAALASLLTALATIGLITNSSS